MSPGPSRSVSVIVPCRNEAANLRALLDSLLRQDLSGLDVEFLIADGRSVDHSRRILADYSAHDPRIRLIDNPGRIVSTGLNAAIQAASGEIVIRMDAHTEFATDYIQACVSTLQKSGADNVGGPARTKAEGAVAQAIAAAYHSPFSTGGARFHNVHYEGPVDTVTYGCWYKSLFTRVGLFDEQLVRNQDDELNLRTIRAGGKIWQSPSIVSWYHPRSKISHLFRQYFQYGYWKVAVIRKHRVPASWRHLMPGAFLLTLACLLLATSATAALGFWDGAAIVGSVLGVLTGTYALVCVGFALITANQYGWGLLPILPIVFATYHAAYGLGFLIGIVFPPRPAMDSPDGAFTELSR